MNSFARFFESLPQLRVAVIGDLMLDTYFFGQVDRISPEAPVPVVTHQYQEERIGGAGNVALNLRSMGASVQLLSLVGKDEPANIICQLLSNAGIGTNLLLVDETRPTTRKTRVLDRNKQLLRLDNESTEDLSKDLEQQWFDQIESFLKTEKPQLLIFEDYNKGVLTTSLIERLIKVCRENSIVTAVDPKKNNFFAYKSVDLFKPNWREVSDAIGFQEEPSLSKLQAVHQTLQASLQHKVSLITLSDRGMFYQADAVSAWLTGHPRSVADVSGAGDTVIAVAAAAYALTQDAACMASLANLAGGLVCEQVGTSPISLSSLREEALRQGWL